jgi:hypothetical protein
MPPATEGWTPYSHWRANNDGTRTVELSAVPRYTRRGDGWRPVDERVTPSADRALPFAAEGAVRPVRFGTDNGRLMELVLDDGVVTVSAPSLAVGAAPTANGRSVVYRGVAPATDLRFDVHPEGVRQTMVLHNADAPRRFTFHLSDPQAS